MSLWECIGLKMTATTDYKFMSALLARAPEAENCKNKCLCGRTNIARYGLRE